MSKFTSTCGRLTNVVAERYYVLARNYQEGAFWAREHGLNVTQRPVDVQVLLQPRQAMGIRYEEGKNAYVRYGRWHDAKHATEIDRLMKVNGFEPIDDYDH